MALKKSRYDKDVFYFFTITCYKWINLFSSTKIYDHIYSWFDILKSKGIQITAFTIMPNHLHAIIFYPSEKSKINSQTNSEKSINQIIGTGKRFMAYEIIKRLKDNKEKEIMKTLIKGVKEEENRKGKIHQVFQPSFDLKIIVTRKFLVQKINYIHMNPVVPKWNLVDDYRYYPHSSAGFYELENYNGYPVTHFDEM
ncbi:MAG: hypothetical protein HY959_13865 [Ignavibacteriae bacterium]|nr:hypothetical protein [Ignavibacteriota bacterium]